MFLIVSWVIVGAIFGSVGAAMLGSATKGPAGGDPNLDAIFFWLFITTVSGAIAGGFLARAARRKYADNKRRLDQLAWLPLIASAILILYAAAKP